MPTVKTFLEASVEMAQASDIQPHNELVASQPLFTNSTTSSNFELVTAIEPTIAMQFATIITKSTQLGKVSKALDMTFATIALKVFK